MSQLRSSRSEVQVGEARAHCDAPCGVYDPAAARIAAEAVLSLTRKILALVPPQVGERKAQVAYHHALTRYVAIKEKQAESAKHEILELWTDYFVSEHLAEHPELHDLVWRAAKLCSRSKQELNEKGAIELLECVRKVHVIFWRTKGRTVPWTLAA